MKSKDFHLAIMKENSRGNLAIRRLEANNIMWHSLRHKESMLRQKSSQR